MFVVFLLFDIFIKECIKALHADGFGSVRMYSSRDEPPKHKATLKGSWCAL